MPFTARMIPTDYFSRVYRGFVLAKGREVTSLRRNARPRYARGEKCLLARFKGATARAKRDGNKGISFIYNERQVSRPRITRDVASAAEMPRV